MFHVRVYPVSVFSHQIGHTVLLSVCALTCLRAGAWQQYIWLPSGPWKCNSGLEVLRCLFIARSLGAWPYFLWHFQPLICRRMVMEYLSIVTLCSCRMSMWHWCHAILWLGWCDWIQLWFSLQLVIAAMFTVFFLSFACVRKVFWIPLNFVCSFAVRRDWSHEEIKWKFKMSFSFDAFTFWIVHEYCVQGCGAHSSAKSGQDTLLLLRYRPLNSLLQSSWRLSVFYKCPQMVKS